MALTPGDTALEADAEAERRAADERRKEDADRSPAERLELTVRLSMTLLELSGAPRRNG